MRSCHPRWSPPSELRGRDVSASDWHQLQEQIDALKGAIWDAPCLTSRPGERTYECNIIRPCRVCAWRQGVMKELQEEYGVTW